MPVHPASPPQLTSGDLVLRAFRDSDVADLLSVFDDEDVARWSPGPHSEPEVIEWMRGRNDWSDRTHASWAVSDTAGRVLGSVSMHKFDSDQRDCELGYWVAPWARRRGIAARAVRHVVDYGFTEMGLHRIYLFHAIENVASCGVAYAAGFRVEGELKLSYRYPDGTYHDEHLHAILAAEAPALG